MMTENEGIRTMPPNTTAFAAPSGNSVNTGAGPQTTQTYGEPDATQGDKFCGTCQKWHSWGNGSYVSTDQSVWQCHECSGISPIHPMIEDKKSSDMIYLSYCLMACCVFAACLGGIIAAIVLSTGHKTSTSSSSGSSSSTFRSDGSTVGSNYTNSRYTGSHYGGVGGTSSRSGTRTGSRTGGRSGGRGGGSSGGSSGGSCFVAGTRIALGNGKSFINIENVKLNDPLAWDLRVTGVHSFRHFLDDFDLCMFQRFQDSMLVTADHMVFEGGKWIYAEDSKHARCLKMNEAKGVLEELNVPVHGSGDKEWIVVYNLDTDEHILPLHYDFFHSNMTHARVLSLPLFSDFVLLDEDSSPKAFAEIAKVEQEDLNRRGKKWL